MIVRTAMKVMPWGLCGLGILLSLAGVVTLAGKTESEPTPVAIEDLVKDGPPTEEYLRITGGGLYMPELCEEVEYSRADPQKVEKVISRFVPILSAAEATHWTAAIADGAKRSGARRVIFVKFEPDEFAKRFPDAARGALNNLFEDYQPEGTVVPEWQWPGVLKDYVRAELGVALDDVVVIADGEKPLQKSDAAAVLVTGLVFGAAGGWWLRRRSAAVAKRRAVVDPLLAAALSGMREGIREALEPTVQSEPRRES